MSRRSSRRVTPSTIRALALSAMLVVLAAPAGCADRAELDVGGPLALAETVPGLIDGAAAVVFTFSTRASCRALVDASADELDELIAAEPAPRKQRIPMFRGQVDNDRDGDFEDGDARHTFGEIPPNVPVAFVAIATTRDPGREFALADLQGTVFAVGCRSLVATPGKRHGLPLVLAPVGLR